MVEPETRAFSRLVRFVPPRARDYVSTFERYEAKGAFPPRWTAEELRLSRGLSSYDTVEEHGGNGWSITCTSGRSRRPVISPSSVDRRCSNRISIGRISCGCSTLCSGSEVGMSQYHLWDVEANNLLGDYETEEEALRSVKELLDTFGADFADEIVLGGRDAHDNVLPSLAGADLAKRAMRVGSVARVS